MNHYMYIDPPLRDVANELDSFILEMRGDNTVLKQAIQDLLDNGWSGNAADRFTELFWPFMDAQENMADKTEEWQEYLRDCHTAAIDALEMVNNRMLTQLEGTDNSPTGSVISFEDNPTDDPYQMGRQFSEDCDDIITRLNGIIGSYASTLYTHGLSISSIRDRIEACADMFAELGAAYVVSMTNYGNYNDFMESWLSSGNAALQDALSRLSGIEPQCGEPCDPSNPVYRAMKFTDNILMQLPLEYRQAVYDAAYAAQEPYKTIFFAYVDQIVLLGTDGYHEWPFETDGIAFPNLGFFIDLDRSDWLETLFHEFGHMVDYLTGDRSSELNDNIYSDVEDYLRYLADTYFSGYTDAEIAKAIKMFMDGKKPDANATTAAGQLQWEIYDKLLKEQTWNDNLSDVYGGATKNAAKGKSGHSDSYWEFETWLSKFVQYTPSGTIFPVISPGLEHFAHNFSDGMMNNQQGHSDAEAMLPTTTDELDNIMNDIYEQAKERMGW